jgi:hypothetical protein
MKLFVLSIMATATLFSSALPGDDADNKADMLRQLRESPTASPESMSWFAALPLQEKRSMARELGTIVLDSDDGRTFVVAFGAVDSPYPWALFVGAHRVELCAGNDFVYETRNNSAGAKEGDIHWTFACSYDTQYAVNRITFQKSIAEKTADLDVPLDGTGWRYVGPKLDSSAETLQRSAEAKSPAPKR